MNKKDSSMDNTSTPTSNQASGSRRVESLREWRWHWQTHLDLTSDIDFTPINPPETLIGLRRVLRKSSKSDKGFGTVIKAGQVRLLSRYVIGDTEYPVHVLVMGPWDTQWLVAPFPVFQHRPHQENGSPGSMILIFIRCVCGMRGLVQRRHSIVHGCRGQSTHLSLRTLGPCFVIR